MMKNTLNIGLQLRYLRTSHTQRFEISQGVRTHLTHLVWVRPCVTHTHLHVYPHTPTHIHTHAGSERGRYLSSMMWSTSTLHQKTPVL